MSKLYINGKVCSGSTSYASAVEYTEEDGNKTNVQDKIRELDEQNKNIGFNLLWENPSPNSIFGAQPVNVDLSSYKSVIIVFAYSVSAQSVCSHLITERGDNRVSMIGAPPAFRTFTISDSGIEFYAGIKLSSITNAATDSNYCIPIKIYGIKE